MSELILADTSVWVAHLRGPDPLFAEMLAGERIVTHPFVIGELALGNLPDRRLFIRQLHEMIPAAMASDEEVMHLVEQGRHFGTGLNWIDAHLLASVLLGDRLALWTRDRRLNAAAALYGRAAQLHQ